MTLALGWMALINFRSIRTVNGPLTAKTLNYTLDYFRSCLVKTRMMARAFFPKTARAGCHSRMPGGKGRAFGLLSPWLGLFFAGAVMALPLPSYGQKTADPAPQQAQVLDKPTARLFEAIERNDLAEVRGAVAAGADITARNANGTSPGDRAVELRHFEIVRYLLSLVDQAAPGESLPVAPGSAPTRNRNLFWQVTPVEGDTPQRPRGSKNPEQQKPKVVIPPLGSFKWSVEKVNTVKEPAYQVAEVTADENPYPADLFSDLANGPQLLTVAATLAEQPSQWGKQVQVASNNQSSGLPLGALEPFMKPDPPDDFFVAREYGGAGRLDSLDRPEQTGGDPDADLADADADLADAAPVDGPIPSLFGSDDLSGSGNGPQEAVSIPKEIDPVKPPTGRILEKTTLKVSDKMKLGLPLEVFSDESGFKYRCIDPGDAITVYCVLPISWPKQINRYLAVTSVMYSGEKYIMRYDGAIATSLHALIPTEAFDLVVAHYQKKYGPPTEALAPIIAPFAQPRQTNPKVIWRSAATDGQPGMVLEIRKFDNLRSAFPDLKRGAVMLYTDDEPSIFKNVSPLDFMLSKKEDVGQSKPTF